MRGGGFILFLPLTEFPLASSADGELAAGTAPKVPYFD